MSVESERLDADPPLMTASEFAEWVRNSREEVLAISRRQLFPETAQSEHEVSESIPTDAPKLYTASKIGGGGIMSAEDEWDDVISNWSQRRATDEAHVRQECAKIKLPCGCFGLDGCFQRAVPGFILNPEVRRHVRLTAEQATAIGYWPDAGKEI
jgi:hypothetical protein